MQGERDAAEQSGHLAQLECDFQPVAAGVADAAGRFRAGRGRVSVAAGGKRTP